MHSDQAEATKLADRMQTAKFYKQGRVTVSLECADDFTSAKCDDRVIALAVAEGSPEPDQVMEVATPAAVQQGFNGR
jgi:hypothetical protein